MGTMTKIVARAMADHDTLEIRLDDLLTAIVGMDSDIRIGMPDS